MKNLRSLFVLALLAFSFSLNAQTIRDVLSDKSIPVTFYGIDFTKAALIGDSKANPDDIVTRQYAGINDLMIKESDKYNVAAAFNRAELPAVLETVKKRNEAINPDVILSSNTTDYNRLTEKDVEAVLKSFKTDGSEGVGVLFVADAMNKAQERMSAWVVVFDNKTKNIILNERHEGKVGMAFSFRNYWAAGLKNIITSLTAKNKRR